MPNPEASAARVRAAVAAVAIALPLVAIAAANLWMGFGVGMLTRDPASTTHSHAMTGALSNLCALGWWTGAVLWTFVATMIDRQRDPESFALALASAALTIYLALDDLYMLHDRILPRSFGVPERLVHALIAAAALAYLLRFRRHIFAAHGRWLTTALVLLAGSMLVDQVYDRVHAHIGDWIYMLEDGLKWAGIVCWTAFAILRCRLQLRTQSVA